MLAMQLAYLEKHNNPLVAVIWRLHNACVFEEGINDATYGTNYTKEIS